jgi:hypothetical protein
MPGRLTDTSDTSTFSDEQLRVWEEQKAMYAGFLAGDRARTDAHIAPYVTIWDGVVAPLADGLDQFDLIRAARPVGPDAPVVSLIEARQPIVDVWGDTAAARHTLHIEYERGAAPDELIRVSTVWRSIDGEWILVHSHEDLFLSVAAEAV